MGRQRSLSVGTAASDVAEGQGRVIRLLSSLQRKKERSDVRSLRGIFALGLLNIGMGLCALITEAVTKLKYPKSSAALLSIESAGIFVGCFAVIAGLFAVLAWKISASGHKSCLISFIKGFCNFMTICSLITFCLSLVALGIYTTLRDWQRKVSPFLHLEQRFVKKIGREDLGFPEGYLEELVILKSCSMSFHLLIFLTCAFSSIFCLFNLYINSLPNFGGCADVIKTAGKMLTLPRRG
ncbi:hypothetical protein BV898_08265 [Hypsibius exemplaris]|uniref:Uncharacterized protein n=1 Tax=Hypsibius exemplaris TaxID=2072580 RepID=A0A1W0WR12_HYPEX|nr:hypothetical protein BV898_08265 [Hypsibius exemplaris]